MNILFFRYGFNAVRCKRGLIFFIGKILKIILQRTNNFLLFFLARKDNMKFVNFKTFFKNYDRIK